MPSSYPEKHFFAGLPFTFADLAKLYQENEQAVALALARFQQLACGDLSRYDDIVLGIRAYAFRPELIGSSQRLLSYVENGGNLVVQYHKPEDKCKQELAPYPITIGESMIDWRVTGIFLTAPYGKGTYTYSSLSWFREIPHLVPGAFRMFVNMISLKQ